MSRFQFEIASQADDEQLRSVLKQTPMPGRISLSLEREPNFFTASSVEGPEHQVIACRDRLTGQIVGLGTRCVRMRFVDGQPCRVGYLGSLRLLRAYRSAHLVARGYQFFKELAQHDRVDWHFTSITDDNHAAVKLLTSGRAGLPTYRRIATLKTLVLTRNALRRLTRRESTPDGRAQVRPANVGDIPALVELLNSCNARYNLSLCHQVYDFTPHSPNEDCHSFRGLPIDRIQTAWDNGRLVGSMGSWDQSSYKQIVVRSLPASWRIGRPLWNALRSFHGQPKMVQVGERLPAVVTAVLAVEEPQQAPLEALMKQSLSCLDRDTYLLLAVDACHPQFHQLQPLAHSSYQNGIYLVGWDAEQLDSYRSLSPVAPELGCL